RDETAVGARTSALAVFGKAIFVLRPQAMHDKRIRPFATLLVGSPIGRPFARSGAVGGRPGQSEHVKVELTWLVLALVLGIGEIGGKDDTQGGSRRQTKINPRHGTLPTVEADSGK